MAAKPDQPEKPVNRRLAAIASQVPPLVRDYIALSVEDAMRGFEKRVASVEARLVALSAAQSGWAGNVQARINRVEDSVGFVPKTRRELLARLGDLISEIDPDADVAERTRALASAPRQEGSE